MSAQKTPVNRVARLAMGALILCMFACAQVATLWLQGAFLPNWVGWSPEHQWADLDGDAVPEEVVVTGKRLSVVQDGMSSCSAPGSWLVSKAFVGDMTHDGRTEIAAIVWKRGSFGSSKPFWIERDTWDFTQHIFILNYEDGQLHQLWMSSALDFEARDASLDAAGRIHLRDDDGCGSTWAWESWGLSRVDGTSNVSMLAVGDVIAHDSIIKDADYDDNQRLDFTPIFQRVAEKVKTSDVAVFCQETPFTDDPSRYGGYPVFGTPSELGDAEAAAGFDVALGATNHALDQGAEGLADTLSFWREWHPEVTVAGIHSSHADAGGATYVEHNGVRLALFDYSYGLNGDARAVNAGGCVDTLEDDGLGLCERVVDARAHCDACVCFLHVGVEYSHAPAEAQRDLCERLVQAGAAAIVCSHPHVAQGVEVIRSANGNEAPVFWSLGNFVSNQPRPDTVLGAAASLVFEKGATGTRLVSWDYLPCVCHFERGATQVFWLEDYAPDFARRHYANTLGDEQAITVDALWRQWCALPKLKD